MDYIRNLSSKARLHEHRRRDYYSQMNSKTISTPILAFGAHPDDIEFGIGALVAKETRAGRQAHFVVVSRGEAASNGTPQGRVREARAAFPVEV